MRVALNEVFTEDTVEEWMALYVDPKVNQLSEILTNAQRQIRIGGRVLNYDLTKLDLTTPGDEAEMNIP